VDIPRYEAFASAGDSGGITPPATGPGRGMGAPFAMEVAAYLADCARHADLLSSAYHPTESGALKMIWHRGEDQADQIRAAFRAAAARCGRAKAPLPRRAAGQDVRLTSVDDLERGEAWWPGSAPSASM
jgi:hypothetical protein